MDDLTKQIELMGRWLNNSKVAAIAAIMIVSALPVLAIGSAAYYSAEKALTGQIIDDNLEQTRAIRESIKYYMDERMKDVDGLAADAVLSEPDVSMAAKPDVLAHFHS